MKKRTTTCCDTDLRNAVEAYQRIGFPIVPLEAGGKTPLWNGGRGSKKLKDLEKHLQADPPSNLGAYLPRRLLVLDVDPRNGGDATFAALIEELGPLPITPMVRTQGGGWHLYFLYPRPGHSLPGTLGQGLDVKAGNGALVVLPPSVGPSGKRYRWVEGYGPDTVDWAELPEAWAERLLHPTDPVHPAPVPVRKPMRGAPTPERLLKRAVEQVRGADGSPRHRNAAAVWLAGQLHANSFPETVAAETAVRFASLVTDLRDHPFTVCQALSTVRSIYSRQQWAPWKYSMEATPEQHQLAAAMSASSGANLLSIVTKLAEATQGKATTPHLQLLLLVLGLHLPAKDGLRRFAGEELWLSDGRVSEGLGWKVTRQIISRRIQDLMSWGLIRCRVERFQDEQGHVKSRRLVTPAYEAVQALFSPMQPELYITPNPPEGDSSQTPSTTLLPASASASAPAAVAAGG